MNRFGYLQDRLFGISLTTYAFNRLLVRPSFGRIFSLASSLGMAVLAFAF